MNVPMKIFDINKEQSRNTKNVVKKMRKIILLKEKETFENKRKPVSFSDGDTRILWFDITKELYQCLEEGVVPVEIEDAEFLEEIIDELKTSDDVWYVRGQENLLKELLEAQDASIGSSFEKKEALRTISSIRPSEETTPFIYEEDKGLGGADFLREHNVIYVEEEEFEYAERRGWENDFYNEIKETFGYTMRLELHWLLIAFVPWILFWLDQLEYISIDIRLSVFVSVLILIVRLFKKRATWLDIASPIFFLAVFLTSSTAPMWVDYLSGVLSSIYLALIWAFTILQGKPLTSEYTRIISNDSPHFIKSNENLTFMWVINFIIQGAMFFLNVNSPIYLFVLLPSVIVTFIYYRKHRSKNKQRSIHPMAR